MTKLIVALDYADPKPAKELIKKLKGQDLIFKVGFELFVSAGPEFVRELKKEGHGVFLDLKFHDIPNTVKRAARLVNDLEVDLFTVHLQGGEKMVRAVAESLPSQESERSKMIGVTVLTSFSQDDWNSSTKLLGAENECLVSQSVLQLVDAGMGWGINGVVCSAQELPLIKNMFEDIYTVVPGIRPKGFASNDQSRVMTPLEAKEAGASAIVVGRPITEAKKPEEVVASILGEIQ